MYILDVNVLLYAFDASSKHHLLCQTWLTTALKNTRVAAPSLVLSGFLRIATNPKLFPNANTAAALQFVEILEGMAHFQVLQSSAEHWRIFKQLCNLMQPVGNDFTDVYIAAFALEYQATLVSADQGFARFTGLQWLNPLI